MTNNLPFISIIIPCRNEGKYIKKCLDSIVKQDYPKNGIEVLAIDGMSEDGTRKIIKDYSQKFPFIKLLENQNRFTPFGLNIGIEAAIGKIIIRMDAHATYAKDYISKCTEYLYKYKTDNVGGVIKTLPGADTSIAKSIALALSHPFGAGPSYFRIGSKEPRWVDTVFGGCYKKEIFARIGLYNEKLIRSQDFEFNLRLKKRGGRILLAPSIISYYYPSSTLKEFLKHNFVDGIWSVYPLKFVKIPFSLRHYIPLIFVASLIVTLVLSALFPIFLWLCLFIIGAYLLTSAYFSFRIMTKEKDFKYLLIMPITFANRHIAYGFGSLFGLFKLITPEVRKLTKN